MLLGEFEHTVDEKNRLTLPSKFRDSFADGLVVTRGMDGCLYAYTRSDFDRLVADLRELDPLSREGRVMNRFFFSGAAEAELDKQGRINLPAALIESAGLDREVVVAGVYDHVEIWDRASWREHLKEVEGSAEHVAERLAAKRD
jgi:transcriptional regulator MraZ